MNLFVFIWHAKDIASRKHKLAFIMPKIHSNGLEFLCLCFPLASFMSLVVGHHNLGLVNCNLYRRQNEILTHWRGQVTDRNESFLVIFWQLCHRLAFFNVSPKCMMPLCTSEQCTEQTWTNCPHVSYSNAFSVVDMISRSSCLGNSHTNFLTRCVLTLAKEYHLTFLLNLHYEKIGYWI